MSGAGRRRQRPARGAPGAALRPLTARWSCYHRRSAAEVRAQGPPGSPPAAAARAHLRAVSLPIREPRDWGQSGRVRRGRRRDAGGDAPRGSAGTSWRRLVPPSNPLYPGPRPPPPLSASPQVLSPPHPTPGPAPSSLLSSRPCGRPSPGGGVPRSRPLRRASARPAGRRLMCPASPSPSPPPSPLLLLLFRRRCRRCLRQSTAEAEADPAAARTRGEAPAHYAPRWGRGRPTAAWERGARGTWHSGGRGRPGTRGRRREPLTWCGPGYARARAVPDAAEARRV